MYYDEEQNNENIKDLKECKGSDKNFEKVLRKNMQKVDNYLFNDSNKLLKCLQLDREESLNYQHQEGAKNCFLYL